MNINQAFEAMAQGHKVKLPEWSGYWYQESDQIKVLTKDGIIESTPWISKYDRREDFEITDGKLGYDVAIRAVKNGHLIAREGWNGKGMFVFMRPADDLTVNFMVHTMKSLPQSVKDWFARQTDPESKIRVDGETRIHFTPYLCMKAADNSIVNGWLSSQTDMLAEDWTVLP